MKALDELRETERRFRSVFEDAPVSLWQEDFSALKSRLDDLKNEGVEDLREHLRKHADELLDLVRAVKVLSINRATVDMCHAESAQELLDNLERISCQGTLQAQMESVLSVWDGRGSFECETVIRTLKGDERRVILKWRVVPGCEETYERVLMSITDITKFKNFEERYREEKMPFEIFIDNLPAGAWVKDEELRHVYVNKYYRSHIAREDYFLNKTDFEVWPRETAKMMRRNDIMVQKSGNPLQTVLSLPSTDLKPRHFLVSKFPIRDSRGRVSVGGIAIDITERLENEIASRRSKELYRRLIETKNELVFSTDENGFISYVSSVSRESWGLEPNEIIGSHYTAFIHADDLVRTAESFKKVSRGQPEPFECRFIVGDGTSRWGVTRARADFRENKFVGISGVMLDVTERKEAELRAVELNEQLRALASRLQIAREEERTLIAREIHDVLGQGLTTLKLGLSLVGKNILEHYPPKGISNEIKELNKLTSYVDELIRDVRQIAGSLRPDVLDELGLAGAVKRHADQISKQAGITCTLHINRDHFKIDQNKSIVLFRIFQEAMTNVVRHSEATRVDVFLSKYRGKIKLRVEDNGHGIRTSEIEDGDSIGILGMKERALSVGAKFSIQGIYSKGTSVQIEVDARE